jgi:hypothetical protein
VASAEGSREADACERQQRERESNFSKDHLQLLPAGISPADCGILAPRP